MMKKIIAALLFCFMIRSAHDNSYILDIVTPPRNIQQLILAYLNDKEIAQKIFRKDFSKPLIAYAKFVEKLRANSLDQDSAEYLISLTKEERTKLAETIEQRNWAHLLNYIPTGFISFALGAVGNPKKLASDLVIRSVCILPGQDLFLMTNKGDAFVDLNEIEKMSRIIFRAPHATTIAVTNEVKPSLLIGFCHGVIGRYSSFPFVFRIDGEAIKHIVCSLDNQYALATESKNAHLLDLTDPLQLRVIATLPHSDQINGVGFSPDNNYCVTGCENNLLTIWEIQKNENAHAGHEVVKVSGVMAHDRAINTLVTARSQPIVLTGSDDSTAKLWNIRDPRTPREISTLKGHERPVLCVRFSPCEKFALTGSKDGTVRVWDIENIKNPYCVKVLNEYEGPIFSVDCTPNLDYIAAGTAHGLTLWNISHSNILRDLRELSAERFDALNKVINSIDEKNFTIEKEKMLLPSLPKKLSNYVQKIYALRNQFSKEITDIITGYVGNSFAYNYEAGSVEPEAQAGCTIS